MISKDALWDALAECQGDTFYTAKKLAYTFQIRGNEMFVDRRRKSITRATVELAYERAVELGDAATGPKKLGCFGASYLYPILVHIGVIETQQLQIELSE